MITRPSPPSLFLRFFRWYCHPKIVDYVEGDLIEVYQRRVTKSGRPVANLRFIIDVLLLFRPAIIKPLSEFQPSTSRGMYNNYFKTAFRNLWKNKGYSALNILGLAIGMSVALLIGLWVKYQASYDTFHTNRDNISLVMQKMEVNGQKTTQTGVMLPLYDELKINYPEVKRATRLDWGGEHGLRYKETWVGKYGHYADPDFLKMFSFTLIKGDINTALNDPHSIIVTESLATALFGDEDPMGKQITLDKKHELLVTGVMKDVPANSTIQFTWVTSFELLVESLDWVKKARTQWGNNFLQTYVELNPGVTPDQFSARIENLLPTKTNNVEKALLFVFPMERLHLNNGFKDWVNTGGAIELVRLFAIVGLLVLGIACINFVNLSTARSEKRAKEVGVRKAIGSHRRQLVMQFLSESMLTTCIAFIIANVIVGLSLPLLTFIGFENVLFDVTDPILVGVMLTACVITGVLAGWYPALYLSNIKAIHVLKGMSRSGRSANLARKILVVTQFTFSIGLIIATSVVFLQIEHARTRSLGYNPNNLMNVYMTEDLKKHYDVLKQELLNTGYVESMSRASSPMTDIYNTWNGFEWEGMDPNSNAVFCSIMVDYDYAKTCKLTIKDGRFFDEKFADTTAIVLNEAAVRFVGFKEPIGQTIRFWGKPMTIIGVIQNVVMDNPFQEVEPAILFPWAGDHGFVRLREGVVIEDAIASIKPIIDKLNPGSFYEPVFTEDAFNRKFSDQDKVGKLAGLFAGLSVFISCLGLFGLASFMTERRTKEIGIRKVVGASMFNLWRMLSREFVLLVVIACLIAIPSTYVIMNNWLSTYAYRTEIPLWIPVGTGVAALMITLLTVSYQTLKVAALNPVKSLRSE